MVGFCGTTLHDQDPIVQAILAQHVGGVILFDRDYHTGRVCNMTSPVQLRALTQKLQAYARDAAHKHHNHLYPLLIAVDEEGGQVSRLKASLGFPKTISAEKLAKKPVDVASHMVNQLATTLHQAGINLDFAPVLDVNRNPNNPVIAKYGRSFSKDPKAVAHYGLLFSKAFAKQGVLCAYKHFPGHGSSTGDSHRGLVDITHTWSKEELLPYRISFKNPKHCDFVMTGHLVHKNLDPSGQPATLSHAMNHHLLRKVLGFDGIIITDDLQMGAITQQYSLTKALVLSINAGANMLLFANQLVKQPQQPEAVIARIQKQVNNGVISENLITQSYRKIVHIKQTLQDKHSTQ